MTNFDLTKITPPPRTNTIDVVVLPVNVAPSATIPPRVFLVEDAGAIQHNLFAQRLSKGIPDEYWQTLNFTIVEVHPTSYTLNSKD